MTEEKIKPIREKTIETLKTYFIEDAQELMQAISELEKNPDISSDGASREELKVYKHLMKFIAFSTLPEEEQLELFRTFLLKAFRLGIDVKNRFAIKMNLTPDVLWPDTAQAFVAEMLKNEEKLGGSPIVVMGERQDSPSTLANWLRDYNRIYGMDRHEKIIPHRYMTENSNVQKLNKEDQILLLKILEFYEGLKFPSQSQIEAALERALDQFSQENIGALDEALVPEEEQVLADVKQSLSQENDEYTDDDIENLIKKFPKVADQTVTQEPIKLLFNGEWVKPTVNNWLADYRAYAGVGQHEVNERSDYLLRSSNVQNLSTEEREKLGLLLRSYDERFVLPFSASKQKIVFERIKNS
jgi:2-oxo-4-hydroxy-4-carboxy--5-ureidoimidazoline (OHCU) decarboxylase